jgi:hypothetical protein
MYRTEILGICIPSSTIAPKTADDLTTSGSRLSNDSGYVDEANSKGHGKPVDVSLALGPKNYSELQPAQPPATSLKEWKISGTLDQLAHIKIEEPMKETKEKTDKTEKNEANAAEVNQNAENLNEIKEEEDEKRSVTLEDVQLKQ